MTRSSPGGRRPSLAPEPSLWRARARLAGYRPRDPEQIAIRDQMLRFIDSHEDAHHRTCPPGHLTASALVADPELERVLLLHHRKLGKWLQPGGHCDGDANLLGVAWREAREETGLEHLEIRSEIIDVDIHDIPARPGEPAHRHLDTRFLVIAPKGAEARSNEESTELRWFDLEQALEVSDASLARMVRWLRSGAEVPTFPTET